MKDKGFTMIELVVAVAIMGVLMIIAIPSINYIQNNNKNAKYISYEKSVTASSKLFTDEYAEDLFGERNTGCAVIRYEDLQERDLIENIQIKDTICDNSKIKPTDYKNYTYVIVRKSKNGNFNYETNTSCRSKSDQLLYGTPNNKDLEKSCTLEDGKGPSITIKDYSGFGSPEYYYDDKLNIKATIKDTGVGLMEGQTLNYQWYKDSSPIGSQGIVNFNNKNYEGSKTKPIKTPGDISKPTKTTVYKLVVNGTLEDVDGNKTPINNMILEFRYFVGTAFISLHANSGSMASSHYSGLSIKSDGYVYNGDNKYVQTVRYKQALGTDGLWNYNNSSWLNLVRTGYHIDNTKEWKSSNGVHSIYDDDKKDYKDTDFCTNLRTNNCYVDLYANWIINTYTLTYNSNGGTACSSTTRKHGEKWGSFCAPTKSGYVFNGWTFSPAINENSIATSNVTATANWKAAPKEYTITFKGNGAGNDVTRKCTYKNASKGCKITSPGISRKGYKVVGWGTSAGATSSSWDTKKEKTVKSNGTYYAVTYKTLTGTFKFDNLSMQNITKLKNGSQNTNVTCNVYNTNTNCTLKSPGVSFGTTYNKKNQHMANYFNCYWGKVAVGNNITISSNGTYKISCSAKTGLVNKTNKVYALSDTGNGNVVIRKNDRNKIYNNGVAKSTNIGNMDDKHAFKWDGDWIIDKHNNFLWFHGSTVKKESKCTSVKDAKLCYGTKSAYMTGWISARLTYQ